MDVILAFFILFRKFVWFFFIRILFWFPFFCDPEDL